MVNNVNVVLKTLNYILKMIKTVNFVVCNLVQ